MSLDGFQKEKFATLLYEILDNLLDHSSMDCLPVIHFIPLTFCHING